MKRLTNVLAHAVDAVMARLWPLDITTRAYMMPQHDDAFADWLTDAEADTEAWEAPPWKWEPLPEHLREFMSDDVRDMNDDLWLAHHRRLIKLPTDQTLDEFVTENRQPLWPVTETPTGAATPSSPIPAGGAGGVTRDEVANIIAVILRGQGIISAPIYADLAARELGHHFQISRK